MEKIKSLKLINLIKCVLVSVLVSLGFILGFAIILKFTTFNDFVIKIINQIIKIISIFFGVFMCLKHQKENKLTELEAMNRPQYQKHHMLQK